MEESTLIFLVSQPRSGSTYLQSLISNHPKVNTTSEPWILLAFGNLLKPSLIHSSYNNGLAQDAFREYLSKHPEFPYQDHFKAFLLSLYQPLSNSFSYVLDKTPRYWEILEEISYFFPKAKIILLQRNPLDVARSMVKTWGLTSLYLLNNYRRDLLFAPKVIQEFSEKHAVNPQVFTLTYENLINNRESQMQALMEWMGLEYSNELLEPQQNQKNKGSFGDPYQNQEYQKNRIEVNNPFVQNAQFAEFLQGYAHYLGANYFEKNGFDYEDIVPKDNATFQNFLKWRSVFEISNPEMVRPEVLLRENQKLKISLEELKTSAYYTLGKTLLAPFRWFKK